MKFLRLACSLASLSLHRLVSAVPSTSAPIVTLKNGSYEGSFLPGENVKQYLGILFGHGPRFERPVPLNTTWTGTKDAKTFGFTCPQSAMFGSFNVSEDCLNLNVWTPANVSPNDKLPVQVWIYGGGLFGGTPNIATYNMSFLVNTSVEIGHPIISVAINYRTNIFGFLSSFEVANANATNIGFYDQRLALQWVQENIGAFGGDPTQVTIQGQSAGAQSVAYQALAFGGRDDHLFRGIIQESGFFQGVAIDPLQFYTEPYKNLTRFVGCGAAPVPLDCLKSVDFTMLQDYLNLIGVSFVWNPVMDNEFFQTYPSDILEAGAMPKLAVMAGTNTDEGLDFTQTGLNTTWELFNDLLLDRGFTLTALSVRRILELYPDDPASEPPQFFPNDTLFPANGLQWRRDGQIAGDYVMHAPRRKTVTSFSKTFPNFPHVFSYRWNTIPSTNSPEQGVSHGAEIPFVFGTSSVGSDPKYIAAQQLAMKTWISFIATMNPNNHGVKGATVWPAYSVDAPKNLVWDADAGNSVEDDTWRAEGIAFMSSISREFLA